MSVLTSLAFTLFVSTSVLHVPQDPATPQEPEKDRMTAVVSLQNVAVADLQASLQALVPRTSRPAPRIVADPRTNSLLVSATREDLEAIQALVKQLDVPLPEKRVAEKPPTNEPTIGVLQIEHRDARMLADVVNQVFAMGPVERGRKPLRAIADPELNVLIAYASRPELERFRELVKLLDRAPGKVANERGEEAKRR